MSLRFRRQTILPHGGHGDTERLRDSFMRDASAKLIDSVSKIHVCSMLDIVYAVQYTMSGGAKE